LPNDDRPAPIGKPREEIRAVRFEENSAYIVTFVRTDPLYKIDLSDRLDPKIAGELEVSGFATYLHPIGDDYMFTIGNEANSFGRVTGLKAELVDVSQDDPVVVRKLILGELRSSSEAISDLHALSVLKVDAGTTRIAFPMTSYLASNRFDWAGLKMLEVTGSDGENADLIDVGQLVTSSSNHHSSLGRSARRSILHGDAVFYTADSAIWSSFWGTPEAAKGPIIVEPIACTANIVNGIEVNVTSVLTLTDSCQAQVTISDGNYVEVLKPAPSKPVRGCKFTGAEERPW